MTEQELEIVDSYHVQTYLNPQLQLCTVWKCYCLASVVFTEDLERTFPIPVASFSV